ncbi:hypothetical protein LI328DRAFT_126877 [Trichoderma asperelloides]|nr:hypothetical protein LI328DRAFT_126877 [Trichoderma asperelloides]
MPRLVRPAELATLSFRCFPLSSFLISATSMKLLLPLSRFPLGRLSGVETIVALCTSRYHASGIGKPISPIVKSSGSIRRAIAAQSGVFMSQLGRLRPLYLLPASKKAQHFWR